MYKLYKKWIALVDYVKSKTPWVNHSFDDVSKYMLKTEAKAKDLIEKKNALMDELEQAKKDLEDRVAQADSDIKQSTVIARNIRKNIFGEEDDKPEE